jgi:ribosomal protein L13
MSNTKKVVLTGKVDAQKWVKENNGYPEVGMFADEKTLKKFYKQLSDEQLLEWVIVEGLTYKPCEESEAINHMRICMAILYKHFPKESSTGSSKPKSKYSEYTTENLMQMAIDHEVPVEVTDDMRIMRMRTIMALRAAKVIE